MPIRVGILSCAHMHTYSFVGTLRGRDDVHVVGIWDPEPARGQEFADKNEIGFFPNQAELLSQVDAVLIGSPNKLHADDIAAAAAANVHILCEKPIATTPEEADHIRAAIKDLDRVTMTAFPCRYAPSYEKLKASVARIGPLKALTTTNRGSCPWGWFTEPELSGGGAMIDHTVHVADLLMDLLGEAPARVQAQTSNLMYSQPWEDIAMLTLEFPSGIFATLDSSWSRPDGYKTWGDVTITAVGERGVIEMDMFGQEIHRYCKSGHTVAGYGSNSDRLMTEEFLNAIKEGRAARTSMEDGLRAAEVAMAAYRSVGQSQPAAN